MFFRSNFKKNIKTRAILLLLFFLYACSPEKPYFPSVAFADAAEVIIKPVNVNTFRLMDTPLFEEKTKIAVFNFEAPEGTQGGVLASDMFTSLLESQGLGEVIERDNIDKILGEQSILDKGRSALSDLEIASRLGKLVAADYMLFGTVTLYESTPQTVYLPIKIDKKEEIEDYNKEYQKYKDWYLKKILPLGEPKTERIKRMRNEENVFSLEELEDEYGDLSKAEFQVIASVGISAKVVDVKTGQIVWLGQGSTNDFTIVNATRRILKDFIKSMQA